MPKMNFPGTSLAPPNFSPHHGMKTGIPFLLQQQIPPPHPTNPKLPPVRIPDYKTLINDWPP